jgi:hypothetical protein
VELPFFVIVINCQFDAERLKYEMEMRYLAAFDPHSAAKSNF